MSKRNDDGVRLVRTDELERSGITPGSWVIGGSTWSRTEWDVTGHSQWKALRNERDGYKRAQERAGRLLDVLLELEPALSRYRINPVDGATQGWDLSGMEKALEFRANEALAKKYTESNVVEGS